MKTIRIDYYTGTGGSKLVAELLAKELKAKEINVEINRIYRDKISGIEEINADYYMLIFSVHSFNAPLPVHEWVKHLSGNHCKTAVISVSGGGHVISNTASRWKIVKLLKKRSFNVIFEEMVRMPNNWMKAPSEKKYTRILSDLPHKIDSIFHAVLSEKKQKKIIYWVDYLISTLGESERNTTSKFGKKIRVLSLCNGCGLCAKNCCSSNIQMENKTATGTLLKPTFGNRCDMCLGCIYNCPQKALRATWGAFQVDRKGYDLQLMCKNAGLNV